jgi:hypothetical protein
MHIICTTPRDWHRDLSLGAEVGRVPAVWMNSGFRPQILGGDITTTTVRYHGLPNPGLRQPWY